jgi:hypothetical protein
VEIAYMRAVDLRQILPKKGRAHLMGDQFTAKSGHEHGKFGDGWDFDLEKWIQRRDGGVPNAECVSTVAQFWSALQEMCGWNDGKVQAEVLAYLSKRMWRARWQCGDAFRVQQDQG